MHGAFWKMFGIATALKVLLIPAYHSTDFEVHRNWLAITHSLPLNRWYYDKTSEWTLDYPPFFAYFEWLLAKVAKYVDPQMLLQHNQNYASENTKYFQRCSVIFMDIIYAFGVWCCLRVLRISQASHQHFTAELLLLLNVGLLFVDHIHFQYNGFLFGILLLSISYMLQERYLLSAFTFAVLLNFKHIFLYLAPAMAVYLLRFYVLQSVNKRLTSVLKLLLVGILPFVLSFGPFWEHLPQLFGRLFPFKRGLTHAYWAPNFWALYNVGDKIATAILKVPHDSFSSTSAGLVKDFKHAVLPTITPLITFVLSMLFMLPVLVKLLFYTKKSESKLMLFRSIVLCACSAFMFGWHVHEKAILMCLIPITFLCLLDAKDAKYALILCFTGYYSLFPLLFETDLLLIRYSLHLAYMSAMWAQLMRIHKDLPKFNLLEQVYLWGFVLLPLYEHILSPLLGLNKRLPFMPLLLTSIYCALGVTYFFISFYLHTLNLKFDLSFLQKSGTVVKSKQKHKRKTK